MSKTEILNKIKKFIAFYEKECKIDEWKESDSKEVLSFVNKLASDNHYRMVQVFDAPLRTHVYYLLLDSDYEILIKGFWRSEIPTDQLKTLKRYGPFRYHPFIFNRYRNCDWLDFLHRLYTYVNDRT